MIAPPELSVNGAAARRPRKGVQVAVLDHRTRRRQWGRGQTAAESRRLPAMRGPPASVNGAAARRPRKARNHRPLTRPPMCVNGAAARRPRKGALPDLGAGLYPLASMGPRPDGRGKTMRGLGRREPAPRQWGRGQTAAERLYLLYKPLARALRQWGRGQTAAESDASARNGARDWLRQWGRGQTAAERSSCACRSKRRLASMGPRPDGRGKQRMSPEQVADNLRQWGRGQTAAERKCTAA